MQVVAVRWVVAVGDGPRERETVAIGWGCGMGLLGAEGKEPNNQEGERGKDTHVTCDNVFEFVGRQAVRFRGHFAVTIQ